MDGGTALELETLIVRLVADPSSYISSIENALTASVKEFAKFEDQMNRTAAVAGGIGHDQLAAMSQKAIDLSNSGLFAAEDLAKGYYTLVTAGLTAAQSQEALGIAEQFATVSAMDLHKATELLINSQTALGMRSNDAVKNAENMRHVAEVLNEGAISTQASAEDFARAIKTKSGAAARVLGKDIEELMGMLKVMASAGVKAELAGEQAYIVMRDLQAASIKNRTAWQGMGVTVYDTAGEMRNLADIFKDLTALTTGMSDEQRKLTMKMLGFTDRSVAASFNLLGLGDAMAEAEAESRGATGSMEEMSEVIKNSLNSQLVILYNNFKNVGIVVGEIIAPAVKMLNGYLESIAKWWGSLSKETQQFIVIGTLVTIAVVALTAAFVALLATVFFGVIAFGLMIAAALLVAPELVIAAGAATVLVAALVLLTGAFVAAAGAIGYSLLGPGGMKAAFDTTLLGMGKMIDRSIGFLMNWGHNVAAISIWVAQMLEADTLFQKSLIFRMGPALDYETKRVKEGGERFKSAYKDIRDALADEANFYAKQAGARSDFEKRQAERDRNDIARFGGGAAAQMLNDLSKESVTAKKEVERLNEQLRRQVETHGMNAAQVTAWRIAQTGATAEQKAAAAAAAAYVTQLTEQEKAVKRATTVMEREARRAASEEERMVKRHQTPMQQFANTIRELQTLLGKGLITMEAFSSEFAEARERMAKDIHINTRIGGMDALRAGSAEAEQIAIETKQRSAEAWMVRQAELAAMAGAPAGPGVPTLVPMPGIAALRQMMPVEAEYGTSLNEAIYGPPATAEDKAFTARLEESAELWRLKNQVPEGGRTLAEWDAVLERIKEIEDKRARRPEIVIEPADL